MNFDAWQIAEKKHMCKSIDEHTLALFNYLRMNNGIRMTRICNSFAYFTLLSYYLLQNKIEQSPNDSGNTIDFNPLPDT